MAVQHAIHKFDMNLSLHQFLKVVLAFLWLLKGIHQIHLKLIPSNVVGNAKHDQTLCSARDLSHSGFLGWILPCLQHDTDVLHCIDLVRSTLRHALKLLLGGSAT